MRRFSSAVAAADGCRIFAAVAPIEGGSALGADNGKLAVILCRAAAAEGIMRKPMLVFMIRRYFSLAI